MSYTGQPTLASAVSTEHIRYDGDTLLLPAELLPPDVDLRLRRGMPHIELRDDGRTFAVDTAASPFNRSHLAVTLAHRLDVPLPDEVRTQLRRTLAGYAASINTAARLNPGAGWDTIEANLPDTLASQLRDYQKAGIWYADRIAKGSCLIGDDAGIGKTMTAIALLSARNAWPAVVLCKPTLKGNLEDEFAHWRPGTRVCVLEGRSSQNLPVADVYLCNFEIAHWRIDDLLAVNPRALVVDESQYLKTEPKPDTYVTSWRIWQDAKAAGDTTVARPKDAPGAWRTWAAIQLGSAPTVDTRLLLSASPAPNGRHLEYLPQLQVLGVIDDFGGPDRYIERYCRWCYTCWVDAGKPKKMLAVPSCDHQTRESRKMGRRTVRNDDASINTAELASRLRARIMVRRSTRQVNPQLPPFLNHLVKLPMSKHGEREYRRAEVEFAEWLREHAAKTASDRGMSVAQAIARAMQSTSGDHEQLVQLTHLSVLAARAKMDAVVDYVADQTVGEEDDGRPRKAVVYAWHNEVQDELMERWPDAPRILSASRMTADQIRADKARFMEDRDTRLIICSAGAASEGHTLTAAHTVIACQPRSSPAMARQQIGRVYGRTNDPHSGRYVILAAAPDTIELDVAKALDQRLRAMAATLDAGRSLEWGEKQVDDRVLEDVTSMESAETLLGRLDVDF